MWWISVSMCDVDHRFRHFSCYDQDVGIPIMLKLFQTKFVAAFLLLFVCMNGGGAVCAAYCRSVVLNASPDHCPLAKKERHCDRAAPEKGSETALAAGEVECCPMIVSFIPGIVETKQNFSITTAAVPAARFVTAPVLEIPRYLFENIPAYRGPPKNERALHITNRILRI